PDPTARRLADTPARLRRLPGATRADRGGGGHSARGRLPAPGPGCRLPQRGHCRAGHPRVLAEPWRDVRHDQVLQRRPGPRGGQTCLPREPRAPGAGLSRPLPHPLAGQAHDRYVETWKAFIELRDEDLIRAIGMTNFQPAHLERLIAETGETPA